MQEITEKEGRRLISSQEAGWWATHANPPIPHDKQIVVFHGGKWFLVQVPDEMEMALVSTFKITETHGKGLFNIVMKNEALCEMLKNRVTKLPKIGKIDDTPVYYGGTSTTDHPDLRN